MSGSSTFVCCAGDEHHRCPHGFPGDVWLPGLVVRVVLAGPQLTLQVCSCDCHASCPLAGRSRTGEADWSAQCICPGAGRVKAGRAGRPLNALKGRSAISEVPLAPARTAAAFRDDYQRAFNRQGLAPPEWTLDFLARMAEIRNAPVLLVAPRLMTSAVTLTLRAAQELWKSREPRQTRRP